MLEFFTEYNEGELLFAGNWGPIALTLMCVVAIVILALTWMDLDRLRPWRRNVIVGMRTVALAIAIALLLEPAVELREVRHVPNHVPILLDVSESMGVVNVNGDTRFELASEAALDIANRLERAGGPHRVHLFGFGEGLERISADALAENRIVPFDGRTDLLGAIDEIETIFDPRDIGALIVISDGIDNAALGERVPTGATLDQSTVARLEAAGYPVHTVAAGWTGDVRDIAIERVYHEELAFIRNAASIDVDIRVLGWESGSIPVTLSREGEPLQTRTVRLEEGEDRYRVSFEFVPETIGKEVYQVSTPVRDGEAVARNNVATFAIKTIRDRIRALHVVGRPSWDQRFLRKLLTDNPNVDLISFFILRSTSDVPGASQDELSLIQFPVEELFTEQLGSFDLVIFQNFTHVPYYMAQYLPNIARYVRDGGGFVMIGGEQAFASGGFAGTPVERILPVHLPSTRDNLISREAFAPQLTEAGHRHPLTRFAFDRAENEAIWESLPQLTGTNVVGPGREGATVLAEHPTLRAGEEAMPIITVSDSGEGRSMALTADSLWRWAFDNVGAGGSSREYNSFWNNSIRWLIRDPELNLVQIELPQTAIVPGEEVRARVRVYESDYSAAADRRGSIELRRRSLDALGEEGEIVEVRPFRTDERGIHDLRFVAEDEGVWDVHVQVESEGEGGSLEAADLVLARADDREIRRIEARPNLLNQVAQAADGRFHAMPSTRYPSWPIRDARVMEVDRREVIDLWSHPFLLFFFALLLGGEWLLRRRWGSL